MIALKERVGERECGGGTHRPRTGMWGIGSSNDRSYFLPILNFHLATAQHDLHRISVSRHDPASVSLPGIGPDSALSAMEHMMCWTRRCLGSAAELGLDASFTRLLGESHSPQLLPSMVMLLHSCQHGKTAMHRDRCRVCPVCRIALKSY